MHHNGATQTGYVLPSTIIYLDFNTVDTGNRKVVWIVTQRFLQEIANPGGVYGRSLA